MEAMSGVTEQGFIYDYKAMPIEKSEKHFADSFDFYKLFWVFTLGSVIGFVVETLWCLLRYGQFQCRSSFVFGPFNAIYGFGALALYVGLHKINRKMNTQIFFYGVVAGTIVEYICSWMQEMVFGTVSWDYSNVFLNINGRACLPYSVFWGLLALLWVKLLLPIFEVTIAKIPNNLNKPLAWGLLIFFVFISIISIAAVARWTMRIDGTANLYGWGQIFDRFFPDSLLEVLYPNMKFSG